jgi:hypothetical protein
MLLWFFLRVCLVERSFEFITYTHVPRRDNELDNSYANYFLYWHAYHQ